MFEQATRLKLRFPFRGPRGAGTEDLWDLTLEHLDSVYKVLHNQVEHNEGGLLETGKVDKELELQMKVVKHVFEVKQREDKARQDDVLKAARKQRLLEILADKQDESLRGMSVEEIQAEIDELS